MFSDTKEYKMSIFCCCSNSPFTSPTSKDCFTINSHFPTFSSFLLPAKPCYHIFRVCFESACFLLARLFKQEGRWKRKAALLKAWEATGRKVQEPFLRQWRRNIPFITKKFLGDKYAIISVPKRELVAQQIFLRGNKTTNSFLHDFWPTIPSFPAGPPRVRGNASTRLFTCWRAFHEDSSE